MRIPFILIILMSLLFATSGCSTKRPVKVIAHRGGSDLAPENTQAAFQNAIKLGVDMIEIDVEQTIDSVVVVIHDSKVDRTTNGTGSVDSLSYSYIKTLDAGTWFDKKYENEKVLTLDETLQLINGQVILLIEIKNGSELYPGIEQRTVDAIEKFNAHSWVIVQSFNKKAIERVRLLDKGIETYYVIGRDFKQYYKELRSKFDQDPSIRPNFNGIAVNYNMLSAASVDSLKHVGLGVFTWTVDEPEEMKKMIDMGVDGIITDAPDKLIDLIEPENTK